jgi:hypothetical protein
MPTAAELAIQLATAAGQLATALHQPHFPQSSLQVIHQIIHADSALARDPSAVSSMLIYYALRCVQEIEYRNVAVILESPGNMGQSQPLADFVADKLQPKTTPNPYIACGREILRFGFDRPLMTPRLSRVLSDEPTGLPMPSFVHLLIPPTIQEFLLNCSDPDKVPTACKTVISACPLATLHFFLGDCIRFVFACPRFDCDSKIRFVMGFLKSCPYAESIVNTFQIAICICLELFCFQVGQVSSARAFFAVYRAFPQLLPFIERMAVRHAFIRVHIAEALASCHETLPLSSVTLPQVHIESSYTISDLPGLLDDMIRKLKWVKDPGVLAECGSQISKIILAGDFREFDIPVQMSKELEIVLKSAPPQLIAAVCTRNPHILKMTIYDLGTRNLELLKNVLAELFQTEAAGTVLPALAKVLLILPIMMDSMPALLAIVPPTVDTSPFIHFMSHNCTTDELIQLSANLQFPREGVQVVRLFRESLKWRPIVQGAFWIIVRHAFFRDQFTAGIVHAFVELLNPISESPIAAYQFKFLIRKASPSPLFEKLVVELALGSDSCAAILIAILTAWASFYEETAVSFIQKNLGAFRSFYDTLSPEKKLQVPAPFQAIVGP